MSKQWHRKLIRTGTATIDVKMLNGAALQDRRADAAEADREAGRHLPAAMSPLDAHLRELVRAVVREELAREREAAKPAEYLATARAAEMADVAEGTIRRWIREGRLAGYRAGRVVRVKRSDLEALLGRDASEEAGAAAYARLFGR